MNTVIIYASKTGHTKKIAEAMAKELGVVAQNITNKPTLTDVDILFIGSGIYASKVSPEMEAYIGSIDSTQVKKAVLFITSLSGLNQSTNIRDALVHKGIEVEKEEFICKGKFLLFSRKHPDEEDVSNAAKFAKKVINL